MFATIELMCAEDAHCINELVEHNCSIPGNDDITLIWRIFNSNGTKLGQNSHTTGDTMNDPLPIAAGHLVSLFIVYQVGIRCHQVYHLWLMLVKMAT